MQQLETIKRLGHIFLDLVFPVSCLVCGLDGAYLCKNCLAKLPRLEKQICIVCHKPTPYGKTHPDCVSRNTVDGAIAGLSYKDKKVNEIIRIFKYNFVSDLAGPLSETVVTAMDSQGLADYFRDFIIVPVPLHTRRLNWRGFNQSELLSKALTEKLKTVIDTDLIRRGKFTKPQTNLSKDERKRNIENAFVLNGSPTNKKILLIDDVVTSGATANELARVLKKGHAAEVWIVSAAHG